MWSSDINADSLVADFPKILESDVKTKGSWKEDFDVLCEKYGVIPCPMIQSVSISEGTELCRIANAQIDLSSWRLMLLACATTNNKVSEIIVHNSSITHCHLVDLAHALKRSNSCSILKLQYITMIDADFPEITSTEDSTPAPSKYVDAFKLLFADDTGVDYISLKGNKLTDEMFAPLIVTIKDNMRLSVLNLAGNLLTDRTCSSLLSALRLNTNFKEVSFGGNPIVGECLETLQQLLLGSPSTPDDDAAIKAGGKIVGDKNKVIKDLNKKRKKAGWENEIPELAAATDCIAKRDGANVVVNRSLRMIDFSHCISFEQQKVANFIKELESSDDSAALPPAAMMAKAPDDTKNSYSRRSTGGSRALSGDCITLSYLGLGWHDVEDAAEEQNVDSSQSSNFYINTIPKPWFQFLV